MIVREPNVYEFLVVLCVSQCRERHGRQQVAGVAARTDVPSVLVLCSSVGCGGVSVFKALDILV